VRIVLLLSWYAESPSWLANVVAGFGRVCDEVVAVDGAYSFYPEAKGRSHPEQAEAIQTAAEAIGVGCTIHRPSDAFYGNEVQKRNLTLSLASALEPDWVLCADADYFVTYCDPDTVRAMLEETDLNVATYMLSDAMDPHAMGLKDPVQSDWSLPTRDIFRWTPDLEYGPAHYTISGTYEGRRQWLKGPELAGGNQDFVEPALDLLGSLVAVHRNRHRTQVRKDDAERYYRARDEAQIESIDSVNWHATT
jgi:hypothetical protein